MKRRIWFLTLVLLGAIVLAACGDGDEEPEQASPTPPPPASPTVIMAAPTRTPGGPTLTPSRTLPPTITATSSPPPPPATETPLPTETPGPYEHVVQPGDDCIGVAYRYGHMSLDVLPVIAQMNNLPSRCILPGPGTTILIPRPTATATPPGADLTQTAVATSAPPMVTLSVQQSFAIDIYTVEEGDTLSDIAIITDSSLRQLCELNQGPDGLDCRGCTFESPYCCCPNPPVLSTGQEIRVPAPTPTPTYTPTASGSETPTPTPTHPAPQPIAPAQGTTVAGPVRFTWLSAGPLGDDEYYLVMVRDDMTGAVFSDSTRQLSLDLPQDYLPVNGEARTFTWQVSVARLGEDGLFYPTGPAVGERQFTWRGWE